MPKKLTQEEFIERSKKKHGDKYDYSKVEYVNMYTKVCIICPIHGEFWQKPLSHLNNGGCKKCGVQQSAKQRSLSVDEFVCKAKQIHGDKYDYSKVLYKGLKHKICIICPEHGEFWQAPDDHLRGKGCKLCGYNRLKKGYFGFGVYDTHDAFSDALNKKCFITWRGMIERCYNEEQRSKWKTYKDCYVCDEWKFYSAFKEWFLDNYKKGFALDKDILVRGNKEYSPDKCCFVPQEINNLFTKRQNDRGSSLIGTSKRKDRNIFQASLSIGDKQLYLGDFKSEYDAFNAYKKAKELRIKELANKYKYQLEPRVYEALYNYKVEITD